MEELMAEPSGDDGWTAGFTSDLDRAICARLCDGRSVVGVLRSVDQYGSLLLEAAAELVTSDQHYALLPLGWTCVRGENVVLFGSDFDLDKGRTAKEDRAGALLAAARAAQHRTQSADGDPRDQLNALDKEGLLKVYREGDEAVRYLVQNNWANRG